METDIEKTSLNACKTVFPRGTVTRMLLNFIRANVCQITGLSSSGGLRVTAMDENVRLHVKMFLALSLVPAADVSHNITSFYRYFPRF